MDISPNEYAQAVDSLAAGIKHLNDCDAFWAEVSRAYAKTLAALMSAGFHRDEALAIITHQGPFKGGS